MGALDDLRKIADAVDARGEAIDRARREGHQWPTIAAVSRMSRAGVIKAHNRWLEEHPERAEERTER